MANRLILKNSLILYIRLLVTTFIGVFSSRFVLSALGVSDYGLYNVVGGIVTMMAFVNTIMVSTTYRYIAYETGKPNGDINKIFNISLTIHIALAVVVLLLAFSVGLFYINNYLKVPASRMPAAIFVFSFSIINTICVVLATPFQGLLIAKEKFTVTVPIEISTKLINLGLVVLLNYLPGDKLRMYAIFITLVHLMNPLLYIQYCLRKYFSLIKWRFQRDFTIYKEMLGFSGWIMFGAAASVGKNQGSALIINRFFGTVMNASFGVANQVGSMVRMFADSLGQAIVPQITKSYSAGEQSRSLNLAMLSSKYSFFLLFLPALPILLKTKYILGIWLTQVPPFTSVFVQIMLVYELINSTKAGLPALIQASGKIKWFQIVSSTVILLSLPAAYAAFLLGKPPYFITYIFTATALFSLITTLILMQLILHYGISLFVKKILSKTFFVTLSLFPLVLLSRHVGDNLPGFLFMLLISELWLLSSIYLIGMEKDERRSFQRYVAFIFQKSKCCKIPISS